MFLQMNNFEHFQKCIFLGLKSIESESLMEGDWNIHFYIHDRLTYMHINVKECPTIIFLLFMQLTPQL